MPKTNFISKILDRREKVERELVEDYLVELARERDFLQQLFDTMSEGVLAILDDGDTLFANSSAMRLLGFRLKEAPGHSILKFLQQPELVGLLEQILSSGDRIVDREIHIQKPAPRILNVNVFPLSATTPSSPGFLVLLQDITDSHARYEEQRRMEKLLSIGHMAAGMAHEIRNPLNSLSLRIQLMKRTLKREKSLKENPAAKSFQEDLSVIEDEIQRLNQVVERVLSASISMPKSLEEISPKELIKDLEKLIRLECEEAGVALSIEMQRKNDLKILGDANALRQVFLNLAQNAIQAMPNGGALTIGFERRGEQVCLFFRDSGRGIPVEDRRRVFEPYYTTRAKGTGLGLVIVERTVQNHGGTVELDSEADNGTEFRVLLPIFYGQPKMIGMKDKTQGVGV